MLHQWQQFITTFNGMAWPERMRWALGIFILLIISGLTVCFYLQNLREDSDPISVTVFNLGVVLSPIFVGIFVALRNRDAVWWIAGIVGVIFVSLCLTWLHWEDLRRGGESLSTTLRNVGILSGGCIAIILTVWRSLVGERQARTAHQQADTAKLNVLDERYERATGSLSNHILWVRLGGIYALQRLAEEYPEQYHIQVMQLLSAFVKNPIEDAEITPAPTGPPRDDVQNAMTAIGRRDERRIQLERNRVFQIDLRRADLTHIYLKDANLSNVRFDEANMSGATLIGAEMSSVSLWSTNISSVLFAEPPNEEGTGADRNPVKRLTQVILDQATFDANKPPKELAHACDQETGNPLHCP